LKEREHPIENEQRCDDPRFGKVMQKQFEKDRRLQHPQHRSPQVGDRSPQRVKRRVRHGIWANLREPGFSFLGREAVSRRLRLR